MASVRKGIASLLVIALVGVVGYLEIQRRSLETELQGNVTNTDDETDLTDDQQNGQEEADRIIAEVRLLIDIPEDVEPTVATIIDVEALRAQNPFYSKAENGDHLVVTPERAILYRSSEKKILDVVPVQLEPAETGEEAGGSPEA